METSEYPPAGIPERVAISYECNNCGETAPMGLGDCDDHGCDDSDCEGDGAVAWCLKCKGPAEPEVWFNN